MEESRDYEEFLHKLLLLEIDEKDKRGVECRISNAKFPYRKYLDDIDVRYLPEGMQKKLPEPSTLHL
ncbi:MULTISPECIES: ATP-binding protein [Clostridium]|uniref:ATP-binding protein n=1 Tax=Clostridium autoethanogenum DSM 10061 TaxID=1341692 RepID=A0ABY4TPV4_9CLOT|nr:MULTISPECIES: ATP-binding protein [Clostridium]URS74502.1 ATP-binding protein [Clostridium autoethanogenum DSM 10061]